MWRPHWGRAGWRVFFTALVAGCVAKGAAFLPLYAVDDYRFLLQEPIFNRMLAEGRFGQWLVMKLFGALGFGTVHAGIFSTALGLVAFAGLGTAVIHHWGLPMRGWLPMMAASLVAIHPYSAEIFTFRAVLATYALSILLLTLLLLPRRWNGAGLLVGTLVFMLALSIYQSVLHFALMVFLLALAVRLSRQRRIRVPSAAGWWTDRHYGFIACVVFGTGIYFVAAAVARTLASLHATSRSQLLSSAAAATRLREIGDVLLYRFWQKDPMITILTKRLLLALLVLAVTQIVLRAHPWDRAGRLATAAAAIGLLACSLIWTLGLSLVLSTFWPVPRTLSHVALLWSAALVIACMGAKPLMRGLAALVAGLVLVGFVGMDNRIFSEQVRINERDFETASRIVARFENLAEYEHIKRLVFIGKRDGYPLAVGTHDMDLNLSAFAAAWSQVPVLVETSGHDWTRADPDSQAQVANYCRNVAPWPGPQSVTVQGDLGIVCLARSNE